MIQRSTGQRPCNGSEALVLALFAMGSLVGCPGILGIEAGVLLADGAAPDAGAPADTDADADAGSADAHGEGPPALTCAGSLVACAGSCVDPAFDANHCGACGRRCHDGTCERGRCPPTTLLELGHASAQANFLEVDDAGIYFDRSGNVMRSSLDGSGVVVLSTEGMGNMPPARIVVTGSDVFWTSHVGSGAVNAIHRSSKVLPSPETYLDLGSMLPFALTLDAGELLFGDHTTSPSTVVRVATVAPPSPQTIGQVAAGDLRDIAANGTYVVAASRSAGALVTWPRAGGAGAVLATGFLAPERVVLDAEHAYVLDVGDLTVDRNGALVKVALADGTKTTLASDLVAPVDLRRSGELLYFTVAGRPTHSDDAAGTLARVATSGGPVLILASELFHPGGVALHGEYVYWTTRTAISRTTR